MSCGVGRRCGSDLALLWLWCRPAAAAPIRPLAWELPYAAGVALKRQKKRTFQLILQCSRLSIIVRKILQRYPNCAAIVTYQPTSPALVNQAGNSDQGLDSAEQCRGFRAQAGRTSKQKMRAAQPQFPLCAGRELGWTISGGLS